MSDYQRLGGKLAPVYSFLELLGEKRPMLFTGNDGQQWGSNGVFDQILRLDAGVHRGTMAYDVTIIGEPEGSVPIGRLEVTVGTGGPCYEVVYDGSRPSNFRDGKIIRTGLHVDHVHGCPISIGLIVGQPERNSAAIFPQFLGDLHLNPGQKMIVYAHGGIEAQLASATQILEQLL